MRGTRRSTSRSASSVPSRATQENLKEKETAELCAYIECNAGLLPGLEEAARTAHSKWGDGPKAQLEQFERVMRVHKAKLDPKDNWPGNMQFYARYLYAVHLPALKKEHEAMNAEEGGSRSQTPPPPPPAAALVHCLLYFYIFLQYFSSKYLVTCPVLRLLFRQLQVHRTAASRGAG